MNELASKLSSVIDQATSAVSNVWNDASVRISRVIFNSDLSDILRTVAKHKENGVKPGDEVFITLRNIAHRKIDLFCQKTKCSKSELLIQIPALADLEVLAFPAPAQPAKTVALAGFGIAAVAFFVLLLGFLTGVVQHLFEFGHYIAHVIHMGV
jgi:hypothetical protein